MSSTQAGIYAERTSTIAGVDGWGATPAQATKDNVIGSGITNNPQGSGFINKLPTRYWYRKTTAPFNLYPHGYNLVTVNADGSKTLTRVENSPDYQYVGCNCMDSVGTIVYN